MRIVVYFAVVALVPAALAAETAVAEEAAPGLNLWQLLLQGGWAMWPLGSASASSSPLTGTAPILKPWKARSALTLITRSL